MGTTGPAKAKAGARPREEREAVTVYKSDGSTVFRKGDPGVPDIAAEKKRRNGRASSRSAVSGRFYSRRARTKIGRSRRG